MPPIKILHSSSFVILLVHFMLIIRLKHLFTNTPHVKSLRRIGSSFIDCSQESATRWYSEPAESCLPRLLIFFCKSSYSTGCCCHSFAPTYSHDMNWKSCTSCYTPSCFGETHVGRFKFIAWLSVSVMCICWGSALQAVRSRVRFPTVSLEFFNHMILPLALCPWGRLSP